MYTNRFAQSCFQRITLSHDYSDYDCSVPRCLPLAQPENPETDPILALVEAMFLKFQPGGLTEAELFDQVEHDLPGVFSIAELQAALKKGLSQGVFTKLTPPVINYCCDNCPVPTFTFCSLIDRLPKNQPYVAWLYAQLTSSPEVKRKRFVQFFNAVLKCVYGGRTLACSTCQVTD